MKTCIKCARTLGSQLFYRHPGMRDGRLSVCVYCVRAAARKNRAARGEYYRAKDRERSMQPKRVLMRKKYCKTRRGRAVIARVKAAWALRNPEKIAAARLINNQKRFDRIVVKPCRVCGAKGAHAHHPNYQQPLRVIWLCPKHHKQEHTRINQQRSLKQ